MRRIKRDTNVEEAQVFASNFVTTGIQNSVFSTMNVNQSIVDRRASKWPIQHEFSSRGWQRSNSFQAERLESSCPEDSYFQNNFMKNSPPSPNAKNGHQSSLKNMIEGESMVSENIYQQSYSSPVEEILGETLSLNLNNTNYGKKCPVCQEINKKDSNWCMECGKAILSVEIRRYDKFGEPTSITNSKPLNPQSSSWKGSYSPPYNFHSTHKEPISNNLDMLIKDMSLSNQYSVSQSLSANDSLTKSSVSFDFENPQFDDIHHESYKHHAVYRRASNGGQNCKEKEDFYPFDDLLYPNFAIYDPNLGYAFPSSNIVSNGFYFPQTYYPAVGKKMQQENHTSASHFPEMKKKQSKQKKKKKPTKFKTIPPNQRFPGYSSQDFTKMGKSPISMSEDEYHWSLPDELVIHIFQYLPMKDIVSCLQVCRKFYNIANDSTLWKTIYLRKHTNLDDTVLQKIAKRKPSSLSLVQCNGKNVTLDGLRNLFKYCSESLEKLDVSCSHGGIFAGETILIHAASRCSNINSLDVSLSNASNLSVQSISTASKRLERLCLNGCQGITDDSIIKIVKKHGPSLEVLEVLGCFNISSLSMIDVSKNCKNLVKLNVGQCHKVTNGALSLIAKNLINLEVLDIRGCKQTRDCSLKDIAVGCQKLKTIILANCMLITDSSLSAIGIHLPKLESIDLCGCGKISDRGVYNLVKGCRQIKSLDLSSTKVTHRSVAYVANHCKFAIESLKLSFCHSITDQCLWDLVIRCKRLTTLHLYGCKPFRYLSKLLEINPSLKIERESLR